MKPLVFITATLCCLSCLNIVPESDGGSGTGGGGGFAGGMGGGGGIGGGGGVGGGFAGGSGGGGGVGGGSGGGFAGGSGGGGGVGGGIGGGTGGGGICGCSTDTQCGQGHVCVNDPFTTCSSSNSCVPGCRDDSYCGADEYCQLGVVCFTEPCAPGVCTKVMCSNGTPACGSTWDCGFNEKTCANHCCTSCPIYAPPPCAFGMLMVPGGINPDTGCQNPPTCVATDGGVECTKIYSPVCSTDYATFPNLCELGVAGATLLHTGACLPGEGLSCASVSGGNTPACGNSGRFYCRDTCPQCDSAFSLMRCTQLGACVYDWDCTAQIIIPPTPPLPDAGTTVGKCVNNLCQFTVQ